MTLTELKTLHSQGKAISGQSYSAKDSTGKILYFIGTAEGRLKELTSSPSKPSINNTVTNITNNTTGGSGVQTVIDDGNGVVVVDNTDPLNPEITYIDPGYLLVETDPVFTAWLAGPPNVSEFTNDAGYITSLAGAVTSVTGTANRITSTGGSTPVIDIDSAYDALWQPKDSDLTSWAAITRATGFDTFATTPSSANLAALVTDEVGTGSLVLQSYVDDKKSFLSFSNNTFNPADSTVYYSGGFASVGPSTTAALRRIYFPSACTITDCTLFIVTNVNGSGETVNFAIRLNNTTDTALTSGTISATATTIVTTGLSISVSAGSYIELKTTTPAWVTNPTGTFISGTLSLKM